MHRTVPILGWQSGSTYAEGGIMPKPIPANQHEAATIVSRMFGDIGTDNGVFVVEALVGCNDDVFEEFERRVKAVNATLADVRPGREQHKLQLAAEATAMQIEDALVQNVVRHHQAADCMGALVALGTSGLDQAEAITQTNLERIREARTATRGYIAKGVNSPLDEVRNGREATYTDKADPVEQEPFYSETREKEANSAAKPKHAAETMSPDLNEIQTLYSAISDTVLMTEDHYDSNGKFSFRRNITATPSQLGQILFYMG